MAQNKLLDRMQEVAARTASDQGGTNKDLDSTEGPRVPNQHPDPSTDGTGNCCKPGDKC